MNPTFFVIFIFATVAGKICNLRPCRNITNSVLQNGWNISNDNNKFDLSTIRTVELTGSLQEKCLISFKSNNNYGDVYTYINVTMSSDSLIMQSTYYLLRSLKTIVPYIVIDEHNFTMDRNIDFTMEYLNQPDDFLKVYSVNSVLEHLTYGELEDVNEKENKDKFRKLLNSGIFSSKDYVETRLIHSEGCNSDLTIHLCPCKNPVIESINISGTDLTCTAVSLDNITIEWEKNTYIQSDTQPLTQKQGDTLLYSSTLSNITHPETYTCIAILKGDPALRVTQDFIIPDEDQSRESDWIKVALPIIIVVVICAVSGVAVWWFKFRRN